MDERPDDWHRGWTALQHFVAVRGTAAVPSRAIAGGVALAHAAGTLPTPLVEKLESLPGWRWHGDDRWRRGFGAVRDYLAQHTTLESVDHVEIDGFALGNWVQRCREDYRSGTLSHAQIDDLESLPGWTWSGPDERWRQGFAALRAYYVRYGSARPPQKTVITGFALGQWVHHRRRDYQLGTLSPDRVAELESLPTWTWAVQLRRQKPRADSGGQ